MSFDGQDGSDGQDGGQGMAQRSSNRARPARRCCPAAARALTLAGLLTAAHPAAAHEADNAANDIGAGTACALSQRSGPRAVVRIIDGATLLLDNDTQVRLIGALAPSVLDAATRIANRAGTGAHDPASAPQMVQAGQTTPVAQAGDGREAWQPAVDAREALAALVKGRSVQLSFSGRQRDRYGRLLAHVFANAPGKETIWLQGALLAGGHARAYGIAGNFACLNGLVAAEKRARVTRRGLWSNPIYRVRSAKHTRTLLALRGTYQLVAGEVSASQRARSGWIYLNFGGNWRTDFSASVPPGVSRAHPAWAASLLDLEGRQVRMRGWIERRNGPMITIEHPGQIEIIDAMAGDNHKTPPPDETVRK